jgi:hypothetical protein
MNRTNQSIIVVIEPTVDVIEPSVIDLRLEMQTCLAWSIRRCFGCIAIDANKIFVCFFFV